MNVAVQEMQSAEYQKQFFWSLTQSSNHPKIPLGK